LLRIYCVLELSYFPRASVGVSGTAPHITAAAPDRGSAHGRHAQCAERIELTCTGKQGHCCSGLATIPSLERGRHGSRCDVIMANEPPLQRGRGTMQTGQRRAEGDPRESTLASGAPTASWPQRSGRAGGPSQHETQTRERTCGRAANRPTSPEGAPEPRDVYSGALSTPRRDRLWTALAAFCEWLSRERP
jgi:hypothetical protein